MQPCPAEVCEHLKFFNDANMSPGQAGKWAAAGQRSSAVAGTRSGFWKRCCKVFGSDEREARGRLYRKLWFKTFWPENEPLSWNWWMSQLFLHYLRADLILVIENNPHSGSCCWAVCDSAVGCELFRQCAERHSLSGLRQKQEPAPRKDFLPEAARPPACSRAGMDGAVMSAAIKHRFSAHYWEFFFFLFEKHFFPLSLTDTFRDLGFQNSAKPWRLILKVCCWVK